MFLKTITVLAIGLTLAACAPAYGQWGNRTRTGSYGGYGIERQAFDPVKRKKLLGQAMGLITDEAPAQFMWRHQLLFGMARNVDYRPLPSERIYGWNMKVR